MRLWLLYGQSVGTAGWWVTWAVLVDPYLKSKQVYACPSGINNYAVTFSNGMTFPVQNYGVNEYLVEAGSGARLSVVSRPAEILLLADASSVAPHGRQQHLLRRWTCERRAFFLLVGVYGSDKFDIIFSGNPKGFMRPSFSLSVLTVTFGLTLFTGKKRQIVPYQAPPLRLAVAAPDRSNYWKAVGQGAQKAGRELGLEVNFQLPLSTTFDFDTRTRNVDDLLAKGTQGLVISGSAYETSFINLTASKTLVFTLGTDAPDSKRVCFMGPDEEEAGRQAGAELKRVLPKGGDVVVFADFEPKPTTRERIRGLKASLQGSHVRILEVRHDFTDLVRAEHNVTQALTDHPTLAACVGIWNYNGRFALRALRKTKKTGQIKIISFDVEENVLTGIQRGEVSATIVQQPSQFGYLSIINMAKYLKGDKTVIPPSREVLVPPLVIRRNTVDAFKKQLQ